MRIFYNIVVIASLVLMPLFACNKSHDIPKGKLYVIGTGCGDRELLTLQALSVIKKCDAFIGMEITVKKLADDIGSRPVLFDPFLQLPRFYRKKYPHVSEKESIRAADEIYKKDMALLRKYIGEGKTVGLLEPGDPTLFGGWRNWIFPHLKKEEIEVIPGMSSFSVASALFRDGTITTGSVILTEPGSLVKNELMVKSAALSGDTLVIFMAIDRIDKIIPALKKHYRGNMPVHIIYEAGVHGREKKVVTNLDGLGATVKENQDSFLGLVYVGRHLKQD